MSTKRLLLYHHVQMSYQWSVTCLDIIPMSSLMSRRHTNGQSHVQMSYQRSVSCPDVIPMASLMSRRHTNGQSHVQMSYQWPVSCQDIIPMVSLMSRHHTNGQSHVKTSYQWSVSCPDIIPMASHMSRRHTTQNKFHERLFGPPLEVALAETVMDIWDWHKKIWGKTHKKNKTVIFFRGKLITIEEFLRAKT